MATERRTWLPHAAARAWLVLLVGAALGAGAARAETPLPPDRLRDAGLEAWKEGRALTACVRLRQYLERAPQAPDRARVEEQAARAREAVVSAVPRRSLVHATVEQRSDFEHPRRLEVARLVARDGTVTVEALSGRSAREPAWQRAGLAKADAYRAFVDQLLDAPVFRVHLPVQAFDPNLPGPRRAVTVRLEVGDDVWEAQGLRGEAYQKLAEAAGRALDFARSTPLDPAPAPSGDAGGRRS